MADNSPLKWGAILILGLGVIGILRKLFGQAGPGPEDQQAAKFADLKTFPELWSVQPLVDAVNAGKLYPYQVSAAGQRAAALVTAALQYRNAKGLIDDNEGAAVGAFGVPQTYAELLLMLQSFGTTFKESAGAYGLTFLDAPEKAAIVKQIETLRTK